MKKIYFIIIGLIVFFQYSLFAQSEDCKNNVSIFAELVKVKDYDKAYMAWKKSMDSCSSYSIAIYSYGEKILENKIKKAQGEEKEKLITSLMSLYKKWLENFPTEKGKSIKGDIISSKAQAMLSYKMGSKKEIYDTFDTAFKEDPDSFTNPKNLYGYFKSLYELYKEGGVKLESLIEKYEQLTEKFEKEKNKLASKLDIILKKEESGTLLTSREIRAKKVYNINSRAIGIYSKNLDIIIAKEATCENLIPLYKRNLELNKGNALWLKRATNRMEVKKCTKDPLFGAIVETLHSIDPSASSAYFLGVLNDEKNNISKAIKYYDEAIALEQNTYKKARFLYKVAVKMKTRGRLSAARNYAKKALRNQPSLGESYLLIAELYANSANDCGNSQFEKRAIYWLAAKTAKRAGEVSGALKKRVDKTVTSYTGRAPSKTDIFTEGKEGETITFSCWINESIKVPKL